MFSSRAFDLEVVEAAVAEYRERHGAFGDVQVVASHFHPSTLRAQGFATANSDGAVVEVSRLAGRREQERQVRAERLEALKQRADRGEISEEQYLTEAFCFI